MDALAFAATRFVRPALRSFVFCFFLIVIQSMTLVKPAQASGTVFPQPNSYCVTFFYIGGYSAHACSSSNSAACAMLWAGSSYSAACGGYCVSGSNCSLPASVYGNQSFYIESTCPDNTTTTTPPCICKDPYVPEEPDKTRCVLEQYTLTLKASPPDEIEPSSQATVIATVADAQGNGKSGVTVNIKVDVNANSGGHDHDDARHVSPYTGTLGAATGTTGADGTVSFTFGAPEISGTHNFTAACISAVCSNNPATIRIDVKVDGLVQIPGSRFYTLIEDDGKTVIGSNNNHKNNHYLTPEAASVLWRMAASYQFEQQFKLKGVTPPLLHLNDASLVWGGVFDLDTDWDTPHEEHMRGTVIDIRANSVTGSISPENFKKFKILAAFYGADAGLHFPGLSTQHFHVRLLNRKE